MRAEDLPRIEELFHAASDLAGAERDAFLARECAGDAALRADVESLVEALESEPDFGEHSALSLGLRVLSGGPAGSLVGRALGHYKVLRMLDGGGMGGEVYLAEDCRLERPVALKFISNHYAGDEWAREQMMKEARAVARLEHPNICPVYGVEEIDGHNFIVMQYVEGETLASLMRREWLGLERVITLAEQIAGALGFAHTRGVIHRDVKPQNIMVTVEGEAKVLDFGLAKFVSQKQGETRGDKDPAQTLQLRDVVGTPAYMSPEQSRGEELDARSDIFSFGVVLYEMLSGQNPFIRESVEETILAVQTDDPPRLSLSGRPTALRDMAFECLKKDRERRLPTANQLARRLRKQLWMTRPPGGMPLQRERPPWYRIRLWRYAAASALALLLLLSVFAGYVYVRASKVHTLAVLPITNASEDRDADYMSAGLTRNLFDKFSYLPRLRIKLPSVAPPDAGSKEGLLRAGRELKADAVLWGSIVDEGGSRRLHVALLDTEDTSQTWEATFDLDSADLFKLQNDITREVSARLGLWLVGDEKSLLARQQTNSEDALRLYMEGQRYYLNRDRENIKKAIDLFERACELDSSFAKAYAGLAVSYVLAANVAYGPLPSKVAMDRARWNARQAIETGPMLPEAHASMGFVKMSFLPEQQEAEQEFRRSIELDRDYSQAHFWYSNLLAASGRFDESVREGEVARSLDPYSPIAEMNYGRALYYARRFDESEAYFRGLLERSPDNGQFQHMAAYVLLRQGRYDEAIAMLERLHSTDRRYGAAALGYAYGKAGRPEDARAVLRELDQLSTQQNPIPPFEKALVYIGMGDRDAAFEMLERAYREQFGQTLLYLTIDPIYDELRPDPRYADLARRLKLAQ